MDLGLLAPFAKWGAFIFVLLLGGWLLVRHFTRDGRVQQKLKQAKAANEAQQRQGTVFVKQSGRDLLDDLKRVRARKNRQ